MSQRTMKFCFIGAMRHPNVTQIKGLQIICVIVEILRQKLFLFLWLFVLSKKKVAKWAYPVIRMPGVIRIEFTDEMTQEEAEEKFGSFIQMIPGTEREVEA